MFNTELATAGTEAAQTFGLVSVSGGKSIRSLSGRAVGEPRLITISHQEVVRGKNAAGLPAKADRHLLRFDTTEVHGTTGVPSTESIYLVIEKPQDGLHTTAITIDTLSRIYNLLAESTWNGMTKFLNNEP